MQRVTAIKGELNAIVVVPHGFDDPNTTIIGEQIIKELDCYGVINYGWKRGDTFDYYQDRANCNNIKHLNEEVVYEEFLEPIFKYVDKIEREGQTPNIFIIHGVSNKIKEGLVDPPEIILGIGDSKPNMLPSFSCEKWVANAFAELLRLEGYSIYFGKAGGKYAGYGETNLNQLYRRWHHDLMVQSIQLEIIHDLRNTIDKSRLTGDAIAMCIEDLLECQENWEEWENHNFKFNFNKI